MKRRGKGVGLVEELHRSLEQWQFTVPPSFREKDYETSKTTLGRSVVTILTSLQPSTPDNGGSGEQDRVSSSGDI